VGEGRGGGVWSVGIVVVVGDIMARVIVDGGDTRCIWNVWYRLEHLEGFGKLELVGLKLNLLRNEGCKLHVISVQCVLCILY
jgi:hypothetical protein